jgi:hypothetical protein
MRGDQRTFVAGTRSVRIVVPAAIASASRFALYFGLSRKFGRSARMPTVRAKRGVTFQRSWMYAEIWSPRNSAAMSPPFA